MLRKRYELIKKNATSGTNVHKPNLSIRWWSNSVRKCSHVKKTKSKFTMSFTQQITHLQIFDILL